jgi:hypothetical protein
MIETIGIVVMTKRKIRKKDEVLPKVRLDWGKFNPSTRRMKDARKEASRRACRSKQINFD